MAGLAFRAVNLVFLHPATRLSMEMIARFGQIARKKRLWETFFTRALIGATRPSPPCGQGVRHAQRCHNVMDASVL